MLLVLLPETKRKLYDSLL